MRSSILIAFGLVVALSTVEAIFRPGYYGGGHRPPPSYHGGNEEDCETKKPVVKTTTTAVQTTTTTVVPTTPAPACPDGFRLFTRTAAADNLNTGSWCMMGVFQKDPILIKDANALCAQHGAALTMLASDEERSYFSQQLKAAIASYGYTAGAVAVDGNRISACISRDSAVLGSDACDKTKSFVLNEKHTSPAYAWTQWAANEPSANAWTYDIEECIQFAIDPVLTNRTERLNDFYCNMNVAPNDPENTVYWNFGALCGRLPL